MNGRSLYYFTFAYPYGLGEEWKRNELEVFSRYFDSIVVIPQSYGGNRTPKTLPKNVVSAQPVLDGDVSKMSLLWFLFSLPTQKYFSLFLREFIDRKVFLSIGKFRSWLDACFLISKMERHPVTKAIRSNPGKKTLYFFWGTGLAWSLVYFEPDVTSKTVIRFHGIDLYEERHAGNYIPFRRIQLARINLAAMVSEHGKRYLEKKYPEICGRAVVFRLGCTSEGLAIKSNDGVLRIVSCSSLIPLKRIHLISKALALTNVPVHWKHIGDGPLRESLLDLNRMLPDNISVSFVGRVDPEDVKKHYAGQPVDLFINVSETEGVPVSIMESFSAGIPVWATDVGGTSEIVTPDVGKLLPSEVTPEEIARELQIFASMKLEDAIELRKRCFAHYLENCDARAWALKLVNELAD
jgi:colanic acid/amylovoran biosynthesis glycosyltransferase